jgi:hypothetical protein
MRPVRRRSISAKRSDDGKGRARGYARFPDLRRRISVRFGSLVEGRISSEVRISTSSLQEV